MSRIHRVRNVVIHWKFAQYDRPESGIVYSHMSVETWCGQATNLEKNRGILMNNPLDDWPVCGTCEGRAIGAGQVESERLTGKPLLFTPRRRPLTAPDPYALARKIMAERTKS